jgi:hypothetical protein
VTLGTPAAVNADDENGNEKMLWFPCQDIFQEVVSRGFRREYRRHYSSQQSKFALDGITFYVDFKDAHDILVSTGVSNLVQNWNDKASNSNATGSSSSNSSGFSFDHDISSSSSSSFAPVSSNHTWSKEYKMMLCRVVCGESEVSSGPQHRPTCKVANKHIVFETIVDKRIDPTVYVANNDFQCYPDFVITYQVQIPL